MKRWTAKTRTQVWGHKNAWSLAEPEGRGAPVTECDVVVEIQGDAKNGYHLVMSPEGFFTADSWTQTLDEAFDDGNEIFGLRQCDWHYHDDR